MIIGFLSNKLTLRGTEVNIYDYADFNEVLLRNRSIIITRPYDIVLKVSPRDVSELAYKKFTDRFHVEYYTNPSDVNSIVKENNIDVLFIEKAGYPDDGLIFDCCKTIIHCVFTTKYPHGDLYTAISPHLNTLEKTNIPVLPYMVRVDDTCEDLRNVLNIPKEAHVFGSYSGADEYKNEIVRNVVSEIVSNPDLDNIYFIYLNIDPFGPKSERLKFLPGTANMEYKRKFINTCDAMLYAREGGETFGLACGEFSVCDKPIIACPTKHAYAHEKILGEDILFFNTKEELLDILTSWPKQKKDVRNNGYKKYTPHEVMNNFKKYLDCL